MGSFSVSPKVLGDNGAKSKTLLMLLCDACKECIISGAMESPRMATQRGAILTKSHVLPLFLQELFVKCVGSCWQRLGALTTEPRSLGVRISTCHRHPQKLVYYARKAHQAALVSTSMNAVSTATKTQGKPNHWLSQLETKHNKAMYCTVFGMHIVGHIMARSENP